MALTLGGAIIYKKKKKNRQKNGLRKRLLELALIVSRLIGTVNYETSCKNGGGCKMNYIQEAENLLLHYNDLYKSLGNIEKQINQLVDLSRPKELSAITLNMTGVNVGKIDDTFNMLYKLQNLRECREKTIVEFDKINEVLEDISSEKGCDLHGKVLKMWYVDKLPKDDIAEMIGYSTKRSVYDIRDKAIRKFAVVMFGIKALETL